MLKCAPYIKSLCSSLHSGIWREGTSSLPGSPVKQVVVPSPTRSEGAGSLGLGEKDSVELAEVDEILCTEKCEDGSAVVRMTSAPNAASLVVSTTDREGEYITAAVIQQQPCSSVKSDLIQALKKIRPESPDVTRAAKRLELAKKQNQLGAISKKKPLLSSPTSR